MKFFLQQDLKVDHTLISSLKKIKVKKIILDPVMVAKGGTKLVDDKSIEIIKTKSTSSTKNLLLRHAKF